MAATVADVEMIGRVYWLGDRLVTVIAAASWSSGAPRNVLIEFEDGTRTVRPFRGLRRP